MPSQEQLDRLFDQAIRRERITLESSAVRHGRLMFVLGILVGVVATLTVTL